MDVTIKINCDNAAFEPGAPEPEIARILRLLADRIAMYGLGDKPLYDLNGNMVGTCEVED